MSKNLYGILIDTVNNKVIPMNINGTLDNYYKILNCDTIDIVERKIGNSDKYFNIICDDNGLLVDSPKVSGISSNMQPMLYGNLFVVGDVDEDGELISLTKEEGEYIISNVLHVFSKRYPIPFPVIGYMDY